MDDKSTKVIVDRIKNLPTLPQIFYRVIELIESPDSSAEDLEIIVVQDQSIAAKILKVANSPVYFSGKSIVDIHQAIVRIGFETLKSIILGISIFKYTSGKSSLTVFSREEFWRHSIGAAEAARLIARHIKYPNMDEAYLIGLIHDIGKVVLDNYFPSEYALVGKYVQEHECSIMDAEIAILGFDHCAVGGWLAEQWKFPHQIKAGIEYHHNLKSLSNGYLIEPALAQLADTIVRRVKFGSGGNPTIPVLEKQVFSLKNLSIDSVETLVNRFQEELERIEHTCKILD